METDNFTSRKVHIEVESLKFVQPHEMPERARQIGIFTDEYSPTGASAVYEVDSGIYVKTPVEAHSN